MLCNKKNIVVISLKDTFLCGVLYQIQQKNAVLQKYMQTAFFYAIKYNYDFYQFAKIRSPPLRFDFTNNQIGGRKNGF